MADYRLDARNRRYDRTDPDLRGKAETLELRSGADLSFGTYPSRGQIRRDYGLRTAVLLSLFCDRLADPSDRLPDSPELGSIPDRRGYWADFLSPLGPDDRWGSRLWELRSEALHPTKTPPRARTFALEALSWIPRLGIGTVEVEVSVPRRGYLLIEITIRDAVSQELKRYRALWDAMQERGV